MRFKLVLLIGISVFFCVTNVFAQKLYPIIENEKFYSLIDNNGKRIKGPFELASQNCFYNDCNQTFGHPDLRSFDPYLIYTKNNKLGIINNSGDIVVKPICDTIIEIVRNTTFFAIVGKNGKQGVIDSAENWIVKPVFDQVFLTTQYKGDDLYKFFFNCEKDSAWCLLNNEGKEILPFVSDEIIECFGSNNLFIVSKNGKKGIYNDKAKQIHGTKYEHVSFENNGAKHGVLKDFSGNYTFTDEMGVVLIKPSAKAKYDFWYKNKMFLISDGGEKEGLMNWKGQQITLPIYDNIESSGNEFIVQKGKKYGTLDSSGKLIVPCIYDEIKRVELAAPFLQPIIIVKLNELYGIYNLQGKLIVPIKYNEFGNELVNNRITFKLINKWGIVNSKGVEEVKAQFDEISELRGSTFFFRNESKYGLGNFNETKQIIPAQFEQIKSVLGHQNIFIITQNNKDGLIDNKGNVILNPEYVYITSIQDEYLWNSSLQEKRPDSTTLSKLPNDVFSIMKNGGKSAIYSVSKKWITPFEYDRINYYKNGIAKVTKDNKHILLDCDGKDLRPSNLLPDDDYYGFKNSYIDEYLDDFFIIKRSGKFGVIKRNGDLVLPIQYDSITQYLYPMDGRDGFALCFKNNSISVLNERAELLMQVTDNPFFNNYINGVGAASLDGKIYVYFNSKGEPIWKENKTHLKSKRADDFFCIYTNVETLEFGNENTEYYDKYFQFPKCIYSLNQLKKLKINNANIDTLLPEIINFKKLNYLSISSQKLNTLPNQLALLENLDTLILKIPALLPSNFETSPLSYLSISSVSNDNPKLPMLPKLKQLIYYGDTLPNNIGSFKSLETLELNSKTNPNNYYYDNTSPSDPQTTKEETKNNWMIPECFYNLKNIKKITISNYTLDTILPLISNFTSLNYLKINADKPVLNLKSLSSLNRLDTLILYMPLDFDSGLVLPKIKYFECYSSNIPELPSAKHISLKCEKLPEVVLKSVALESINIRITNPTEEYYEGMSQESYDLSVFFKDLQKLPLLKTISFEADFSIVYSLLHAKEEIVKCKALSTIKLSSTISENDKTILKEAFPGIIVK